MALTAKLLRLLRLARSACSFSAIALSTLALQNAGYLVLMGYAQQLQEVVADGAAAGGDVPVVPSKKFATSHFLALTELIKLVISAVWFVVDEVLAMQVERHRSRYGTEKTAGLLYSGTSARGEGTPKDCALLPDVVLDGDMDLPSPVGFKHPSRYMSRHFGMLLMRRMRHTIGLDRRYKEALLMVVPAIVYAIQGILVIHALTLLNPTMFQVLYQVRILFTAVMLRAVFGLRLSVVRWLALVALMLGITMTQIREQSDSPPPAAGEEERSKVQKQWSLEGTLAALAGAFLSAFSGVFMEFVLKKRNNHFRFSARNVHLALFSVVYFAGVFLREIIKSDETSDFTQRVGDFCWTFFDGFTGLVWFLVVLQALGGMLVAVVVRYCDNIVKAFSTASAVVLNGTASVFLFDLPLSVPFVAGSLLVMTSITVYGLNK